jgi:hypothetical protein
MHVYATISLVGTSLPVDKLRFPAIFPALKALDYRTWGILQAKSNAAGHPKMGSEVNHLAAAGCQSEEIVLQNCRSLRPHLEKACDGDTGFSNYFSRFCPCLSFKTILLALNYGKRKLFQIFI